MILQAWRADNLLTLLHTFSIKIANIAMDKIIITGNPISLTLQNRYQLVVMVIINIMIFHNDSLNFVENFKGCT